MKLPGSLQIVVFADSKPLQGAWVAIQIGMTFRNPYHVLLGPTPTDGSLTIGRAELLQKMERNLETGLMDYGDPHKYFSGEIEVRPMNREGLRQALKGYEIWRHGISFPPDYEASLKRALEVLVAGNYKRLHLTVVTFPNDPQLKIMTKEVEP